MSKIPEITFRFCIIKIAAISRRGCGDAVSMSMNLGYIAKYCDF